jgi:hypothetical protein
LSSGREDFAPERVLFAPWLVGILVLSALLKLWMIFS